MWLVIVLAAAAAEPALFIDSLVAPGLEGCDVQWRGKTTILKCLGTKVATTPAASPTEAEAAATGLAKSLTEKGHVPLHPDDEALRDIALPVPQTNPPLTSVSRLEGKEDRVLIGASGKNLVQCNVADGATPSCRLMVRLALGEPRPPVGHHPLVLLGHPFLGSDCVLGRDQGLRCGSGALWAQRRQDADDVFDGFSSLARHASDVDCRFLGTPRRCRAALQRPPGTNPRINVPAAEAWLAVWIEHDDIRIVCRSDGPATSPLCATVFGTMAFDGATSPRVTASVPLPKAKDHLAGCRRTSTSTDLVVTCADVGVRLSAEANADLGGALIAAFAATAPGAPVAPVVRVGDHDAVRFGLDESGPTLTMQAPRGQAAVCEIGKTPLELARPRCADIVAAMAAGDTRPFVFQRLGLRYTAPRSCRKILETAMECGDDSLVLYDVDKIADYAATVRKLVQAPVDVPCAVKRAASEARCVRGGFETDGVVQPFLIVEATDFVALCAMPKRQPSGPCADIVTFKERR